MESYIVRIYRRDERGGAPVRGMIETVDARNQEVFGTKEELWEILSALNNPGKKQKKRITGVSRIKKKKAGID